MQTESSPCVRLFVAAITVAGMFPLVASAQVGGTALEEFVAEISEAETVEKILYTDIDRDGVQEALLIFPETEEGSGQEWRFIHDKSGQPQVSLTWAGNDISLVADIRDDEGKGMQVVSSDGMTFGFSPNDLFTPVNHLYITNLRSVSSILESEAENIRAPGGMKISRGGANALRLDLLPQVPGTERLVTVVDEGVRDADFQTPYFLLNNENEIIHQGTSLLVPFTFRHASGGLSIIEQSLESYSLVFIPPEGV